MSNFYMSEATKNILLYGGIGVGVLVFIIILFLIIKLVLGKKGTKVVVDVEFMNTLIETLGGLDNISSVEVDNSRLKLTVVNREFVKLATIQTMAQNGVFVTGNTIKVLFKEDSIKIKRYIEQLKR